MSDLEPSLGISAVERETGLSKDVLRKWESRYGFPLPSRDAHGERLYPAEQVTRLRIIKRLMDAGMRPSTLVRKTDRALLEASAALRTQVAPMVEGDLSDTLLTLLRAHESKALRRLLGRQLQQRGLWSFVQDVVVPMTEAVGDAWARGMLEVHEEHLYTEVVQGLLRSAVEAINDPDAYPHILLTTLPDEVHGLGLLMVASVLALGGAHCLSLGVQTPLEDIARAACAHRVNIVALSFSGAYPKRRIAPALGELRQRLDPALGLWAGGAGTQRVAFRDENIRILPTLADAESALNHWRSGTP
jgi:DNA-binding transcriptional MerR regulator/methylmalonyl-CoA mutase cobalamin-binding subunit